MRITFEQFIRELKNITGFAYMTISGNISGVTCFEDFDVVEYEQYFEIGNKFDECNVWKIQKSPIKEILKEEDISINYVRCIVTFNDNSQLIICKE
jgi:hypothetical protein